MPIVSAMVNPAIAEVNAPSLTELGLYLNRIAQPLSVASSFTARKLPLTSSTETSVSVCSSAPMGRTNARQSLVYESARMR